MIYLVYWNLSLDFSTRIVTIVTALIAIVLAIYLSQFYLPTTYTIDREGIHERRPGFKRDFPWQRVRRIVKDRRGVFISPFPEKNRLDNFRGMIMFYLDNEKEVIQTLQSYKPELFDKSGGDKS